MSEDRTNAPGSEGFDVTVPVARDGTPQPSGGGAGGPALPRFEPDARIGTRYRVVRFLGKGGMGEVYEAEDQVLKDHVAVKTVRASLEGERRAVDRFLREIQLARRVTHPNVCRIFDVGFHRDADGASIAFLTMELLLGETLSQHLARKRRLTAAEARPIVAQLTAGLGAAHAAGIVHRDLKTSNVVLVHSGDSERAVITDFGLARALGPSGSGDDSYTVAGDIVGSPAYMSPEQVEGADVGPASDVYSLGIVMYQMVSGALPYVAETPLAQAVKRLSGPPAPPSAHCADLPPSWDRAIMACLERDPARRWNDPAAVLSCLDEEAAPRRGKVAVSQRAPARRSVAVIGFKNLARRPDTEWISVALAEMLRTELAAGEDLRAIPGESVGRMRLELGLEDTDSFARDTLRRIRDNLGSDFVVIGSYLVAGREGRIRLDVRLQDAETGEFALALADSGTEEQIFDLVERVGARLRVRLGGTAPGSGTLQGIRAALPRSPEATRLYAEGLSRLRLLDALGARDLLERAVAADPDFPLAHAALAESWDRLGYDVRAAAEAKRALDLSAGLPRKESLRIEARHHSIVKDWDGAITAWRALHAEDPDDLDVGLDLCEVYLLSARWSEARDMVEVLRRLPAPDRESPRIDLALARAQGGLADYAASGAAAGRASSKAMSQGARLVAAQALCIESWAQRFLGDMDRAGEAIREAERIFGEAGDRGGVAYALIIASGLLYDQGRFAETLEVRRRALTISEEIGSRLTAAHTEGNIGWVLYNQGELAAAIDAARHAAEAEQELGDVLVRPWNGLLIASCLLDQGKLQDAAETLGIAHAELQATGDMRGMTWVLHRLGDIAAARGDLDAARSRHEDAQRIRGERGYRSAGASSRVALGRIALDQGRAEEAAGYLRDALDRYGTSEAPHSLALAHGLLAVALARCGRREEAQGEARAARALAAKSEAPRARIEATLAALRAESTLGGADAAAEEIERLIAEADRFGLVPVAWECRFEAARRAAPDDETAGAALETIAREARDRGLERLARQVEAELSTRRSPR
ncbi:MAG: protein kinase [Acidobacteriota bacterium]